MVAEREDVEEKCLYATELFGTAARNCVETDVLGVRESVRSDDDAKDDDENMVVRKEKYSTGLSEQPCTITQADITGLAGQS